MKKIVLLMIVLFSSSAFAVGGTETVSFSYEYEIEYQKITAKVICLTVYDAHDPGDLSIIVENKLWYSAEDYKVVADLESKGFKAQLNSGAGEQCETELGSTPSIDTMAFTEEAIRKSDVELEMKKQNKNFVTRNLVFVKTSFDKEVFEERQDTAKDDVLSDIWNK